MGKRSFASRSRPASFALCLAGALALTQGCGDQARPLSPHAEGGAAGSDGEPLGSDHGAEEGGAAGLNSAGPGDEPAPVDLYDWQLPKGFPKPAVPADNPMTADKVELGRHLFYDQRLSDNSEQSCASCHQQELAFTDGLARAVGSTGELHPRGSMSLGNVAYASTLTWANPLFRDLERQALVPIFSDAPVELGLREQSELVERLAEVDAYQELFAKAFPEQPSPITANNAMKALASFQRTMITGNSPFDRYQYRSDESAMSEAALRGLALFSGERLECFHCHVGFNLSDHTNYAGKAFFAQPFHNTGLYNLDDLGAFPEPNRGVFEISGEPRDMGRFKAPSLRNVAVTAPYMHDGSIATLSEVLDHYAAGGRTIADGPYRGDGSRNPLKSNLI
ncbi:MAG: Methylamine utilization protein mauG, partial [Polyangiaceae bacterium]|nr:Methylamine utilization protein mauG [Polyangiaceae bacterium]